MSEDNACCAVTSNRRAAFLVVGLSLALILLMLGHSHAGPLRLPAGYTLRTGLQSSQSTIDSVPGSNTIVDIARTDSEVWAATGRGASRYLEATDEWETFTVEDGLGANEVPALHKVPGADQIWVATSHSEVVELRSVPFGDGLFLSTDGGATWVERSPDIDQASGPFQICYDITSFRGTVAAACFAGGLVTSADVGQTWTNLFASSSDESDFESRNFNSFSNRYFALAVDTVSSASVQLYGGTAAGIRKYTFHDPRPAGRDFQLFEAIDGGFYAGTEAGLAIKADGQDVWRNYSTGDGLPTAIIGAVGVHDDAVLIGLDSVAGQTGAGLAYTDDNGATWDVMLPSQSLGDNKRASAIIDAAGAWWVACQLGGLIRSDDDGQSWTVVWPDANLKASFPTTPPEDADYVTMLLPVAAGDTTILLAGTAAGMLRLYVPNGESPARGTYHSIGDVSPQGLGQFIVGIERQDTYDEETIIWSLNKAIAPNDERTDGFAVSADTGQTWQLSDANFAVRDVAFAGDAFWILTDRDMQRGDYPHIDTDSIFAVPAVVQLISDGTIGDSLRSIETVLTGTGIEIDLESIWVGSDSGLAYFPNFHSVWDVVPPNGDFTRPDAITSIAFDADTQDVRVPGKLGGNFVTALELQRAGGQNIIWAGTQSTGSPQTNGISRSEDGGATWTVPVEGHRVWNFAFNDDTVWVATSEGLLMSGNTGITWDTLTHFVDPVSGAYIDSLTEVFGVEVVGDEIWVGTNNGFAILDRDDPSVVREVVRGFKCENCAFPSPFSPRYYPNGLRFRFVPTSDGPVTISIYDFSNRLVRELRFDEAIVAGIPHATARTWDGRNGEGDLVAIGAYFYVVEYSDGGTDWGKFAVIH